MVSPSVLSGLKVVEFGDNISAPFCAKLLGDLGAAVIKVEQRSGDEARRRGPFPGDASASGKSPLFIYLNASKCGIVLNVESAQGRALLLRLLERADVLVENNPPAAMQRLGLTYEELREVSPSLVVTSLTSFGQTGPYHDCRAHSIQISAMGGVSVMNGQPNREPLAPPYDLMEYAGGLYGCVATCFALLERDCSGLGQHVDVSLTDCCAAMHTGLYIWEGLTGKRHPNRSGRGEIFPNGLWRCKDGYISMIAPQVAQWIRFVKVMGDPEWTKESRYRDRRAMAKEYPGEVDDLLAPWFMAHTKDEIFAMCREAHVPVAPVRTIDEVTRDDHLKQRGFFVNMRLEDCDVISMPGSPYRFSESSFPERRPPPKLGEHTEDVLAGDLGLSEEEIRDLRRTGVI